MFIKTFEQLNKDMYEECGGKASHLGELTNLGLNVPPGYTVLGEAYYHHIEANRLKEKISTIFATIDFDKYEMQKTKLRRLETL